MARRVVIVALEPVQALDVTGPAEVLAMAGRTGAYAVEVVSPGGAAVETGSGFALAPAGALEDVRGPLDTLLVAGGAGARHASEDVVARVGALAARSRRVASVCTGAYVLAAAGLLDGRRATTHWEYCDDLQRRHPRVAVERDPIFVVDGPVRTSAGVTAGMDLALALVEEDLGPRAALEGARRPAPAARAGGGGPGPARRARGPPPARAVRQAPRRAGPVQRPARRPERRARAAARPAGVDGRPPPR